MKNILTSGILQSKAEQIHKTLVEANGEDLYPNFIGGPGWMRGFQHRHNLKLLSIHGEKESCNQESFESFKEDFMAVVEEENFTHDMIYNADESALFFKMLPNKTIALENEKKVAGRKTEKKRITFMPCANASGTNKMKMMVIGHFKNPRCFPKNRNNFPG